MNDYSQDEHTDSIEARTSLSSVIRGRVVSVHKDSWELVVETPEHPAKTALRAVLSGRFRNEAAKPADLPVVGDWVEAEWAPGYEAAVIRAVEPRKGLLARKRPGDAENDAIIEQPIAANVDLALLTMAVDDDFSPRRLERYLTMAWDASAKPVVVLTKADLAGTESVPDLGSRIAEAEAVVFGARVVATSAETGEGLDALRAILKPGLCAILLGSSGVGKSTLVNALAGSGLQAVAEVRAYDGKGRHTTTSRRLLELPWGAYLVDTPGVRELQLWGDEESLAGSFPDVEGFAVGCRFPDCAHEAEPGCAVLAAVESGELPEARLESWRRLRRELAYLERKADTGAARAERDKWKPIMKQLKRMLKDRNR